MSLLPLALGPENVHRCHTAWLHLVAVEPQASALKDTGPLKNKHLKLLSGEGREAERQIFSGLEANVSNSERLVCMSCLRPSSHRL